GIKGTFKERQRDWPGAGWVPLLSTGGAGQIKTARAPPPASLPTPSSCTLVGVNDSGMKQARKGEEGD
ncbi:hypothetical protein KUCAC02_025535, partial [Chaenocephalus aceratus]